MENSPSMTTTAVPILNEKGKDKLWFPVSVCCASDLCHFLPNKKVSRFYYKYNKDIEQYELYKRSKLSKDKMVQYLDIPKKNKKNSKKIIENNNNNKNDKIKRYLTFLSYDKIDSICKLMK